MDRGQDRSGRPHRGCARSLRPGYARRLRPRRYDASPTGWQAAARRRPDGAPARPLRGRADRDPARRLAGTTAVPLLRQGQPRRDRAELRDPRVGQGPARWICCMGRVGEHPSRLSSGGREQGRRPHPVAVDVHYATAGLARDFRAPWGGAGSSARRVARRAMIEELEARFGIAGAVRFETGAGRLVRAVVTTPSVLGQVYLHGAHVTHYVPAGERPLLFTSPRSQFVVGKAIRGGVPVIFPWFGPRAGDPTAPEHGFARVAEWAVDSVVRTTDGSVAVTLRLDPSDATRATWPHDFRLRHEVVFGPRLTMTLEVENRGRARFSFEEALHTYLLVGDVRRATIGGLEGTSYVDK